MVDMERVSLLRQELLETAEAERVKKNNEDKYKENSKKRLMSVIEKKFKTTMIGALARVEDGFGSLWGHGQRDLTPEQQEFRKLWTEVRTDVLNNGNNQLRGALDEIANYTMSWDKFKTEFVIRPREEKGCENDE